MPSRVEPPSTGPKAALHRRGAAPRGTVAHVPRPPWTPAPRPAIALPASSGAEPAPGPSPQRSEGSVQLAADAAGATAAPAENPPRPNRTGLPNALKAGVEALSGLAMDDVRVHRNSAEPAKLGALAFARGEDIHLGPGQEEHLPHEAWHVVQQKQGRVPPRDTSRWPRQSDTDPLEREADTMGAACANRPPLPEGRILRRSVNRAQTQLRIKHGNKLVAIPKSGCSKVIERYIKYDPLYIMKSTWNPSAGLHDKEIHLLDSWKKYILGEIHPISKWDKNIAGWKVNTLVEGQSFLPEEGRKFDKKITYTEAPLEPVHNYVLQAVLIVQNGLNLLKGYARGGPKSWTENISSGDDFYKDAVTALDFIGYVDILILDKMGQTWQYVAYEQKLAAEGTLPTPQQARVFALADIFRKNSRTFVALRKWAQAVTESPKQQRRAMTLVMMANQIVGRAEAALGEIVIGLMKVLRIQSSSREGRDILEAAKPSETLHSQASDVLMPRRDAGMAARINAMHAPVLVRLGQAHLKGVLPAVTGPKVGLTQEDDLETYTLRR